MITKLQDGWPTSRLDELLPDPWAKAASRTILAATTETTKESATTETGLSVASAA